MVKLASARRFEMRIAVFFTFILMLALTLATEVRADQGVIAVVNDHAITNFDIDQRIKLLSLLGERNPAKLGRKEVANALINDYIKIDEARLDKIDPTPSEVDDRLKTMANGLKTDRSGLESKLSGLGLSNDVMRQYVTAQMSFARLLQAKYHEKLAVDPGDVDKKLAAIKVEIQGQVAKVSADPRRQPVRVLSLQEINFPVDGNDAQLLQSRAIEAGQVAQKLSSCAALKAATSGIFNVQIGRKIEADARKLPPPLLAQMQQRGLGHAIGPMRYKQGIQLLAYCGSRMIVPPKINVQMPTRQQVENLAMNDKFSAIEQKYVAIMRKGAVIDYKDKAYAQ